MTTDGPTEPTPTERAPDKLTNAGLTKAERLVEARRASVPTITYPEDLPISQRRDEIAELIRDHQVVIVAGETGSGKTTQIPKICLELGRGVTGTIGHTQPRRLAARTVATRIAEELGTELGEGVGYAVRFTDKVKDTTLVKLMTDGILLAELQRDRMLSAYDTIIVDEAHERSLNIDFILGYLAQLLPRRPDLKVIVTSATIETERFSEHFAGAPIIEVSGRTYPVEMRYRPLEPDDPDRPVRDQITAITEAVDELSREKPGDVLVFLSGEREIHDTASALRALDLRNTEIIPLYARLSSAEQHRVFEPHPGRRIVLATNVAETSLTVPGIRYVVDPGTARISRYSQRLKVQRLPIEAVSQASANQRAGRCGRVAAGICIRLYSEEDFESRDAFTEPEMLRTNLASVILQMTSIGLGDIAAFPFIDPPDAKAIADGVRLLQELGALDTGTKDQHQRLTEVGRKLARLPVDPRFGRMVLEAQRNGCLREVLVIASALSIQDPRERPQDKAGAADQLHARFVDDTSDFLAFWNLWRYVRQQQRELSSNQFRRLCRTEHLNYLRIREWQDVHSQLRKIAGDLGMRQANDDAEPDAIHRSLLAGLLSHIGMRDREKREYIGARQARFALFRGTALAKKQPQWVMAAELVDTSRLWARTAARIEPEWAEQLGGHLTKHSYSEPHWSTKRGAAMVHERVTLYGLPIVADRVIGYGKVDPEHAREIFIRHALVEGDWQTHHKVFQTNRELLDELEELEHRFRRTDLIVGEDRLEQLYDERLPDHIVSARSFDAWWKKARRNDPELLTFTPELLLDGRADGLDEAGFPEEWHQGDLTLPVSYAFSPGAEDDGVTVHIPVAVLNQVQPIGFDWQVPGFREELITEIIRSLPKTLRRSFVPVPDYVHAFLERVEPGSEPLLHALERELPRLGGEAIPPGSWNLDQVPEHLRISFLVNDPQGRIVGESRDLAELQARLAGKVRGAIADAVAGFERTGLTSWEFGTIERQIEHEVDGQRVKGYPALADEGETVGLRILTTAAQQRRIMWRGTRRLLRITIPLSMKGIQNRLTNATRLALGWSPYDGVAALLEDCVTCSLDDLLRVHGGPAWTEAGFDALRVAVKGDLESDVNAVTRTVGEILTATREIDRLVTEPVAQSLWPTFDDVAAQRASLVYKGFVSATGRGRLDDIGRYLEAARFRLETSVANPSRDQQNLAVVQRVQQRYDEALDAATPGTAAYNELVAIGWTIEELRVSLFAQQLGTPEPVSEQRILKAIASLPR